ncbi:MFS transporter [Denitrificimonas sp. JX-1]|uniref:MFS transporter n=1 Tax=Denitrificimonas halotolerans TaxID=3098930 RepID=A0ABU5GRK1_9GAMM|nr:MFS transporter [Denitrificimonas sp. JX-1]MDY7219606.1 MFS transporter [Denitrificimonas sp. JX-1]
MPVSVWGLAIAQALLTTGNILLVAVSALIGKQLASHPALITVPVAMQFLGLIVATLPAAHLMHKLGRKVGFILGNSIGLLGTWVALQGLEASSLMHFAVGTFLIGMAIGTGQQYRFAALDVCNVEQRPRAISMVMAGGILAAILGPNLAIWSRQWFDGNPFVGAFYGLFMIYVLALLLISSLRLATAVKTIPGEVSRSYYELFQQPLLVATIASGAIGYAIMVLLMTATPIAMQQDGFPFSNIAWVIQWHVLGMYVPSFFTGHLIRRFSSRSVILWGCAVLALCVLVNVLGNSYWHYLLSLMLLGVGWNFTYIGATHLLTFTYRPAEQGKVQGINEFMVFTAAAVGSLLAGMGVDILGWFWLNIASLPPLIFVAWWIFSLADERARERVKG